MRWATPVVVVVSLAITACSDLRDFRGTWAGPRVGEAAVVRVGPGQGAQLVIDELDLQGLRGRLTIGGLVSGATIETVQGAEADVLVGMTFTGAPLRVYLAFVAIPDSGGDALALIALYDDRRIEIRVLRAGTSPLYGIYALTEAP